MRAPAKLGDRIELDFMGNDPNPIPPGSQGTVDWVNELKDTYQIGVKWDNGRGLMLVPGDQFHIIKRAP